MSRFDAFCLSNLTPADTGLPNAVVWISAGEYHPDAHAELGPRIVVVPHPEIDITRVPDAPSVLLTDPPELTGELPAEVMESAVEFAKMNREALLRHWNGELGTRDVMDALVRVAC